MLFSSLHFLLFFSLVFFFYWFVFGKRNQLQNLLLLAASYLFYGLWDVRFLMVLLGVSLFNYILGLAIGKAEGKHARKFWLLFGLIGNIGTLVSFKYFDFFLPGIISLFDAMGLRFNFSSFGFFVPLGISFYIFLSISYLVDVYRKQLAPEKNIFELLLAFSFFPIVMAGPINKPISLLPQIKSPRVFDAALATDGLRQFLWGLCVKMIIADNCAVYADTVFSSDLKVGSSLFFGAIFFTIQIYADFSSYSDMAIGIAKVLGFRLVRNFNFPYFAKDIGDFWRRWHISLTSWFRDYVFLPLAYFLSGKIKSTRVLFIPADYIIYSISILFTWSLTGLWHGANTTFLVWGLIHAMLLIFHQISRKQKKVILTRFHLHNDLLYLTFQRIFTLTFVVISWIFFRSPTLPKAMAFLDKLFSVTLFHPLKNFPTAMVIPIVAFFTIEWFQRNGQHGLDFSQAPKTKFIRWFVYLFLIFILFFYQGKQQDFIYFNF